MLYFKEPLDLAIGFNNLKLIDSKDSQLQKVSIYMHPILGRMLTIDDEVQHVEVWAPLYHEMIVHFPCAFISKVKNVLILGGGSLFAAAEVLKYTSVKKVTLVDHDKNVIDIVSKNYSHAKRVRKDKRFELRINDAFADIKSSVCKYDLIINDSVDLIKHGRKKKIDLLNLLCSNLNYRGICVDLVYRHIFERKTTKETLRILKKEFQNVFSLITVPEYPGIFHVLCLWSRTNKNMMYNEVINEIQRQFIEQKKSPFQYYDPQFLSYYRYFPKCFKQIFNNEVL